MVFEGAKAKLRQARELVRPHAQTVGKKLEPVAKEAGLTVARGVLATTDKVRDEASYAYGNIRRATFKIGRVLYPLADLGAQALLLLGHQPQAAVDLGVGVVGVDAALQMGRVVMPGERHRSLIFLGQVAKVAPPLVLNALGHPDAAVYSTAGIIALSEITKYARLRRHGLLGKRK